MSDREVLLWRDDQTAENGRAQPNSRVSLVTRGSWRRRTSFSRSHGDDDDDDYWPTERLPVRVFVRWKEIR